MEGFTSKEVAKKLGISKSWLNRLAGRLNGPDPAWFGRSRVWTPEQVRRLKRLRRRPGRPRAD